MTEGPLGMMARRYCLAEKQPFTTSYHTRFPEYVTARLPIPEDWTYPLAASFHNSGQGTMVATQSLADDLSSRGFNKLLPWTRGVNLDHFRPDKRKDLDFPRPIFLCVGRVAVEKNLPAFLDLDLPGSKVMVGEGPELAKAAREISARPFPRSSTERGTGRRLRLIRRVRLSEPYRHVRQCHSRGAGKRHAGSRLSGHRPDRHRRRRHGRRVSEDLGKRALAALEIDRPRPANEPALHAGRHARRCSSTMSAPPRAARTMPRPLSRSARTAARRPAPRARSRPAPPRLPRRESRASALPT